MWFRSGWNLSQWWASGWWGGVQTPVPPTPEPTPAEPSGSGGFLGRMPKMPWAGADPWQRRRITSRPPVRFKDEKYDDYAAAIDEEDAIVSMMMME